MENLGLVLLAIGGFSLIVIALVVIPQSCNGLWWTISIDGALGIAIVVSEIPGWKLATYSLTAAALVLLAVWAIPVVYGASVCSQFSYDWNRRMKPLWTVSPSVE